MFQVNFYQKRKHLYNRPLPSITLTFCSYTRLVLSHVRKGPALPCLLNLYTVLLFRKKVQNTSYSFMSYIALFSISPITLPFDIEFDCFRREKKGGQPSDTVLREVHHGPATLDDDVWWKYLITSTLACWISSEDNNVSTTIFTSLKGLYVNFKISIWSTTLAPLVLITWA